MQENKKLHISAILNMSRTILAIVFPILTMPYINRVLGIENIGKINFVTSYINYFILFSGLGISSYAIREGAKVKDDKLRFTDLINQLFTLNLLTTIISYILLFMSLLLVGYLENFTHLILIYSVTILGTTISVSWFFNIVEDYLYVTVRTIIFQVVSVLLMFLFVKTKNDLSNYAWILVISQSGASLLNFYNVKKTVDLKLTFNIDFKNHLKPILILFATAIAMVVYVNSDITMLGFISGTYATGLYATSVKIYSIVKNVLASLLVVMTPRLSYYLAKKNYEGFNSVLEQIWKYLLLVMFPIIAGLLILSDNIILFIAGSEYLPASMSLKILMISTFFALLATFCSNCILLPLGKENRILKATVYSAIVNVGCNFFLIPLFQQNGASWTTLLAEILVSTILLKESNFKLIRYVGFYLKIMLSTIVMSIFVVFVSNSINMPTLSLFVSIFLGVISYIIMLIIFKVDIAMGIYNKFVSNFSKS